MVSKTRGENLQSRPTREGSGKLGGDIKSGGKGQQDERTSPYIKPRGNRLFIVRLLSNPTEMSAAERHR